MNTSTQKPIGQTKDACLRAFALAALFVFAAPVVQAQTPGALDLSFDTGSTVNSDVRAIVPAGNGKVYVGGLFTSVRGAARNRIARLNADGTVDETFNPGAGVNGGLLCVVVQTDGKVLIGGQFTSYNGTGRNNLARLNTDGSLDTSFVTGTGGSVSSIAVQADGKVVIGGDFTSYNGTVRNRIARLNSDGSLDTSFNPGTGANDGVRSVAIQADGKVLIGGYFTSYDGAGRNHIARLKSNGNLDTTFNPGSGTNGDVYSVAVQADGKVLIGGLFSSYNGTPRGGIARLQSNGSLDTVFNPTSGAGTNPWVMSVAVQPDGKVLIGGFFTNYNGTIRNFIARINSDGSLDTTFDPGTGANSGVFSIALQGDGRILIGGYFTFYNGAASGRIARVNSNGSFDATFINPVEGVDDAVYSIALQPDEKVLIAGKFAGYGGVQRRRIARLNSNGTLDTAFKPGTGANNWIWAVAMASDGKLLIVGDFTSYNGTARNRIARLNSDGSLDVTFNPGTSVTSDIYSIVVQVDGKVLIGGLFTSYNGTARNRIARLDNDGSADVTFNPGAGANGSVYCIAVQSDGKVLIGGQFTSYNGTARNYLARLNTDGSLDTSFNPGTALSYFVNSIAVGPDGKVLVGGSSYIARLNSDGSLDTSFQPGSGVDNLVTSLALQTDGKVFIGGYFTSYNGTPRSRIARLNNDGSLDTGFDPGAGANGTVLSLALQADGKVLIGGIFGVYNGTPHSFLARATNAPATRSLSAPSASRVEWLRGGATPEIEQASFEHSADATAWTALGGGSRSSGGWELTGLSLSATGYIRARGRTTGASGFHHGGSSVIEQIVSYSTPAGMFDVWAAAAGLTGLDATPGAAPHGDAVPNVLKYAFNMNGSGSDSSMLVPGTGTNGLPVFTLATGGSVSHFRCEFIRRIASGLIYSPRKSADLSPPSWVPLTDSPTVLPINADWERVIYEESFDPIATPKCFYCVEVTLP